MPRKRIELATELEPALPMISADPVKLRQALINLLGNAMKFNSSPGVITLGARMHGESGMELFVKDTGVGLTRRQTIKIFDKFYQVNGGPGHSKPGLGLGLALVKAIAAAHRGSVAVNSIPGVGSTFSIQVPLEFASDDKRRSGHVRS